MAGARAEAVTYYKLAAGRTTSLPEQRYLFARAARLTTDFLNDLKGCEDVTLETWKQRPLIEKIIEPFAWILERQQ